MSQARSKEIKFGIDIDQVLAAYLAQWLLYLNQEFQRTEDTAFTREQFTEYHTRVILPDLSHDEVVQMLFNFFSSDFFDQIKPIDGASEGLAILSDMGKLYLITARQEYTRQKTVAWLAKYFPGISFEEIVFTNFMAGEEQTMDKADVCAMFGIHLLVEDSLSNIHKCHPYLLGVSGIKAFLMDAPWNQSGDLPEDTIRVRNWEEIIDCVHNFRES